MVNYLEENQHGELLVEGTQLIPGGKAAERTNRSFVWIQGESEPAMARLGEMEAAELKKLLEGKTRLPTRNGVPYVSPATTREIRADLRSRARPEVHSGHLSSVLVKSVDGTSWPRIHRLYEKDFLPPWLKGILETLGDAAAFQPSYVRFDDSPRRFAVPGGIHVARTKELLLMNENTWEDKRRTYFSTSETVPHYWES